MTTTKYNEQSFTYKTQKDQGTITLFRRNNENVAAIRDAEINGIKIKFDRFTQQDNKAGILINLSELHKALTYVPNIDKQIILQFKGHAKIETIYNKFSKIAFTNKIVESGFGFKMKDTKNNWVLVNKHAARMTLGVMNEDVMSDIFQHLPGFKITSAIHPLLK